MIENLLNFGNKFGWSEIISIFAFIVSILSWLENRKMRIENRSIVNLTINSIAADTRNLNENNIGELKYYIDVSISNLGGRTATFLGFRPEKKLPLIIPIKNDKFINKRINYETYLLDHPISKAVIDNQNIIDMKNIKAFDEFGNLNIKINSGETKNIKIAILIRNHEIPLGGYFLNMCAIFNNGLKSSMSSIIQVNNS
jgi:hypothetical protein